MFDDIIIDLSKDATAPATLPEAPPIDLLGGLGEMEPGQVVLDAEAVHAFMQTIGERNATPPKREFLVRSNDPTNQDDYILYIDNSALEMFNTCNRKSFHYLVRGRESTGVSAALTFGGAFHSALEQRYKRGLRFVDDNTTTTIGDKEVRLSALQDAFIDRYMLGIKLHEDEHRTPDRCKNVVRAYNERYAQEPFEFIEVNGKPLCEVGFAVPLCRVPVQRTMRGWQTDEPTHEIYINDILVVWTGRIDLPVLWDGVPTIIDHKTTSMLGTTFADQFRLSPQMLGYCWAANNIPELTRLIGGKRFQSLCVNAACIRKPTRTGVPTEFVRNRYFYDDSLMDEWLLDTNCLVTEFIMNFVEGYFPKKANWCIGKYGACQYLDVCSMPVGNQRRVMLNSDRYRDVTWNPLDER